MDGVALEGGPEVVVIVEAFEGSQIDYSCNICEIICAHAVKLGSHTESRHEDGFVNVSGISNQVGQESQDLPVMMARLEPEDVIEPAKVEKTSVKSEYSVNIKVEDLIKQAKAI